MSEKPLDRLNYFNGQRLEADDFKTEQDYHIRVRRWLNKSLYSAGIARGLVVRAVANEPAVMVGPGLALDALGREIILLGEQKVPVEGDARHRPGSITQAELQGLYLTVRHTEEVTAVEADGCEPVNGATRSDRLAWRGPSRIRSGVQFGWRDFLPPETSGEVVLALVELTDDCSSVLQVDAGVRRYVGAASAAKVRQYALEGEREVAAIPTTNPLNPLRVTSRVHFHIRGRQPSSVTLYLKAEELSALHYTELAAHEHGTPTGSGPAVPEITLALTKHRHAAGDAVAHLSALTDDPATQETSAHTNHSLDARQGYVGPHSNTPGLAGFVVAEHDQLPIAPFVQLDVPGSRISILSSTDGVIEGGAHSHPIGGSTAEHAGFVYGHTHTVSGGASGSAGAADPNQPGKVARKGTPLGYVHDLRISIDKNDRTASIRDQIRAARPSAEFAAWALLGNGASNHPIADADKGTGPIRIDFIQGVTLDEGEHVIEFSVPLSPAGGANGGKIVFNLYVE